MVSDLFIMQDTVKIIRIQDTNGVWPQSQKQKYSQDYPTNVVSHGPFLPQHAAQQHYVKIIRLDLDQDDNDGGEGADKVRSKKSPGQEQQHKLFESIIELKFKTIMG